MGLGGVVVECGRGLGAKISGFGVEVEGADAVRAMGAGKPHAVLNALDSVGFHWVDCKSSEGGCRHALGEQLR